MKKMKQTYLTLLAAATISAASNAAPILFDINGANSPNNADASDFIAVGVTMLTGSETVIAAAAGGNTSSASAGGITLSFDATALALNLNDTQAAGLDPNAADLLRDYYYLYTETSRSASIGGSLGLSAGETYTLTLIGTLAPAFDYDGDFTPVNGANITYASTVTGNGVFAVNFTTGAGYVDGTDTLDFTWGRTGDFAVFNGFAITSPIPEPSTALLAGLGLAGLTLRRRRR